MRRKTVTRRRFMSSAAGVAAGLTIVPRHVLGAGFQAPSDTVNIAVVGGGARGASVATELVTGAQNIVALCDVDMDFVDARIARSTRNAKGQPVEGRVRLQAAYAKAKRYADFRTMLEQQRDIDAVMIATPDHTHAVIAKAAMELGKHVYVEKPMAWSVYEARVLRDVAARTKVVTQMGNQGQSSDGARLINEWIQAGLIGTVQEAHYSSTRPIWPQGVSRPSTGRYTNGEGASTYKSPDPPPGGGGSSEWSQQRVNQEIGRALNRGYAKPAGLNWDLFLGPAPDVPYHPIYHPFNWRGWVDWGTGPIGDGAAHSLNHLYWALDLKYPTTVEATFSPFGLDEEGRHASFPSAMEVVFQFPGEGSRPPVKITWRDGGLWAPRPAMLPADVDHRESGSMIIGDKGILMHDAYGMDPKLYPASLMEAAAKVPRKYPRVAGQLHAMNWVDAIRGRANATSHFDYASRVTETMLLGIVAARAGRGVQIAYDGATGRITNNASANQFLTREYRKGWQV